MLTSLAPFKPSLRSVVTVTLGIACLVLAIAWPGWMTELRAQGYYHINKTSGDGATGTSGSTVGPLEVSLDSAQAGLQVNWTVTTPGGGTIVGGTTTRTTFTDAHGRTSVSVVLGNTTPVTVSALLVVGNEVQFTVNCSNCEQHQHITPQQQEQAISALQQMSALAPSALLAARTQITNIGIRLLNLRRGGGGVSTGGLSLNKDGENIPVGLAAGQAFSLLGRGGGASADPQPFGNLGVFVNGLGTFGNQTASSKEPGYDFHTAGMTAGADYRVIPSLVLGGAFGYASTGSLFANDAGDMSAKTFSLSGYAGFTLGGFHVDGILTYGWTNYDTERNVVIPGGVTQMKGDPTGDQIAVSVNTGYDFTFGALTLGPSIRVNYVNVDVESFREHGATEFILSVRKQNVESLTTSLGGEVSYALSVPFGVLTPLVRVEWEHEYLAGSRLVSGTLIADPTQTLFSARTNSPDRDYVNLGAGITGTFQGGWSSFFYYETVLGKSRVTNHSLTLGIRREF